MAKKRRIRQVDKAVTPAKRTNDGLKNVVAGLATNRDKSFYSDYTSALVLTEQTLANMYRVSWLSQKIVDIPADDMTKKWREFYMPEEAKSVDLDALVKTENKLKVKAKFNEAIKWARLYGGCLIVMGLKDGKHDEPLDYKTVKKDDLKYLMVVDMHQVNPSSTLVKELGHSHFGKPESYNITGLGLQTQVTVHHSRCLVFEGKPLPYQSCVQNNYWSDSVLQHCMDAVKNKDSISAAMVTLLFEANIDVIKSPDIADRLTCEGGDQSIIDRFQTAMIMKSISRVLLLDKEEDYERKSYTFAGLPEIANTFMMDVSGAADIPATRLFGKAPDGMNATGDGDTRNYYDSIGAKQESDLRPLLETLDEVLLRSVYGEIPDGYSFDFCSLWQMSDKETAEIQKLRADRDSIYITNGIVTEGIVAKDLKDKGTYPSMSDEDVKLAEGLSTPYNEGEQL